MKSNYYEVLGIGWDDSAETIRRQYRLLAKKYHPDVNKSPSATRKFQEINNAYETLIDEAKRKKYDAKYIKAKQTATQEKPKTQPPPQAREVKKTQSPPPAATVKQQSATKIPEFANELTKARLAFSLGNLDSSEEITKSILSKKRNVPAAWAILGDIKRFRGDIDGALTCFTYASQYEPLNSEYRSRIEQMARETATGVKSNIKDEYKSLDGLETPIKRVTFLIAAYLLTGFIAMFLLSYSGTPFELFAEILPFLSEISLIFCISTITAGALVGGSLALCGRLDRMRSALFIGGASGNLSPVSVGLFLASLLFYWSAPLLYIVVGAIQNTTTVSVSRLYGAVSLLTIVMSIAYPKNWVSALIFGGSFIYIGFISAWQLADQIRYKR